MRFNRMWAYLGFILVFLAMGAKAQSPIEVSITGVENNADTLSRCRYSSFGVKADVTSNYTGSEVFVADNATYSWNFGDGTALVRAKGLEQTTHTYTQTGAFVIVIKVTDEYGNIAIDSKVVRVGLAPDFSDTEIQYAGEPLESTDVVCWKDVLLLNGIISSKRDTLKYSSLKSYSDPIRLDNVWPTDTSYIWHGRFDSDATLTDIGQIDSLSITIEHSALKDVQVSIMCPDDSVVVLKTEGTGGLTALGVPFSDPDSRVGEPYTYSWSPSPALGTMTAEASGKLTLMPVGTFASDNPLSNLIGCRLNGDWRLIVEDNTAQNNGHFFGWQLHFDPAIVPSDVSYLERYDKGALLWLGDSVELTQKIELAPDSFSASAFGYAVNDVVTGFTFRVKTIQGGCQLDTTLFATTGRADFEAPESEEAPAEVEFRSNTPWASGFDWDFGDEETSVEKDPLHTYNPNKETTYTVFYTATSKTGECSDTISKKILIRIPDSSFKVPNFFSPNDDGINDLFQITLSAGGDKKLSDVMRRFECSIYNRDGRLVYRFENALEAENGWDGSIRDSDRKATPGVYFWVIKAEGKDNRTTNLKRDENHYEEAVVSGFVHLYR